MGKHRKSSIPPEERPYDYGYQKPNPKHGFQKGQVANPKGRPRKMSLRDQLDTILNQKIKGREGRKITIFEAMVNGQVVKAVRGDTRATAYLIQLREKLAVSDPRRQTKTLDDDDLRIIEEFARKLGKSEEDKT